MKIAALLVFLFAPMLVSAQSLHIRGFGGIMMNTKTDHPLLTGENSFSRLNAGGGIGAAYRDSRFEYGASLSYRRYSFVEHKILHMADDFDPATGLSTKPPVETTLVEKYPAFVIAPVFNYHFGRGTLDWYAGLSPAYIRYTTAAPGSRHFSISDGANGWSLEAQVGAAYPLRPGLRLFGELQGGNVRIPMFGRKSTQMWAAGLNFGVQLRVWEKGH